MKTTSKTADKAAQFAKEARIRANGGTFIREKVTRELIDISNVPTRVARLTEVTGARVFGETERALYVDPIRLERRSKPHTQCCSPGQLLVLNDRHKRARPFGRCDDNVASLD